jgi:hypothetical protein
VARVPNAVWLRRVVHVGGWLPFVTGPVRSYWFPRVTCLLRLTAVLEVALETVEAAADDKGNDVHISTRYSTHPFLQQDIHSLILHRVAPIEIYNIILRIP